MRYFVILLVLSTAPRLHACSCASGPLKYAFKRSAAVFVGEVSRVVPGDQSRPTTATLTIGESFKGPYPVGHEVVVRTSPWGETCGVHFEPGPYLVQAARDEHGQLQASLCGHTFPRPERPRHP
jgi:hypothetical protein